MSRLSDYINNNLSFRDEYVNIFGKSLPQGKCFCVFHENKNTPAAKLYGNVFHCFSCNKSYRVYDLLERYNPQRIREISESVIVPSTEQSQSKIRKIEVDRNKPISEVIRELI